MKRLSILFFTLLIAGAGFAQQGDYLNAYNLYNDYLQSGGDDDEALEEALEYINKAVGDDASADKPKWWFYHGQINQALFIDTSTTMKYPNALMEASNSFMKALSIEDTRFRQEKECEQALDANARLLYNISTQVYNQQAYEQAYNYAKKFDEVYTFMEEKGIKNQLDKFRPDAVFVMAYSAAQQEDYEEAKKLLNELIEMNYDNANVYKVLSNLQLQDGDSEKALETLDKAIERYPENLSLLIDQLNIYITTGEETKAIDKMEKAVELDPTRADLYYALGQAYAKADMEKEAIETYKTAIETAKKSPDKKSANDILFKVYNNLGALYYNKGIEINKYITENSLDLSEEEYNKKIEERDGLYAEALPFFQGGYEINPDDCGIIRALKEIYAKMGEYGKSKEMKTELTEKCGG